MITLIAERDINKRIGILELEQRLKSLYTLEELVEKYEYEKPLRLRDIEIFKSKITNINQYNFYFDFNLNSNIRVKKGSEIMRKNLIRILITFERTKEYLRLYTKQLQEQLLL